MSKLTILPLVAKLVPSVAICTNIDHIIFFHRFDSRTTGKVTVALAPTVPFIVQMTSMFIGCSFLSFFVILSFFSTYCHYVYFIIIYVNYLFLVHFFLLLLFLFFIILFYFILFFFFGGGGRVVGKHRWRTTTFLIKPRHSQKMSEFSMGAHEKNVRVCFVRGLAYFHYSNHQRFYSSRKHLHTKVIPDFHLKYSKNGGNLGSESK